MSDTPYIPFTHLPTEVTEAAETLHVFFEKQGMREWQYSHVADRRLVNKLERELNAAKANLIDEAVKRMDAVPIDDLRDEYMETLDDEIHSFEDRDKPFTTEDLVNTALESVRTRLISAAKGKQP